MTPKSNKTPTGRKHIQAMLILNIAIPVAWIGDAILKDEFTVISSLRGIFYYGLIFLVLNSIKNGNEKNRKFVGGINLFGVLAAVLLIATGNKDYPIEGLLVVTAVWAYTAWACLLSKSVKDYVISQNERKGEPGASHNAGKPAS